jgi:hypothetical protein
MNFNRKLDTFQQGQRIGFTFKNLTVMVQRYKLHILSLKDSSVQIGI